MCVAASRPDNQSQTDANSQRTRTGRGARNLCTHTDRKRPSIKHPDAALKGQTSSTHTHTHTAAAHLSLLHFDLSVPESLSHTNYSGVMWFWHRFALWSVNPSGLWRSCSSLQVQMLVVICKWISLLLLTANEPAAPVPASWFHYTSIVSFNTDLGEVFVWFSVPHLDSSCQWHAYSLHIRSNSSNTIREDINILSVSVSIQYNYTIFLIPGVELMIISSSKLCIGQIKKSPTLPAAHECVCNYIL